MTNPTRQDYMDGKVSHREYYAAVVKTAGITRLPQWLMDLVRQSTDEHYNDVPLRWWDQVGDSYRQTLARAFREHGDCWTMAGSVCALKEAARQTLEGEGSRG